MDRKFLACVLPAISSGGFLRDEERSCDNIDGGILVLIDQHAADERIRVERYMRELCKGFTSSSKGPDLRALDPPIRVLLTRREVETLERSDIAKDAFRKWGIRFGPSCTAERDEQVVSAFFPKNPNPEGTGCAHIEVQTVPDVVADKVV